MIKGVGMGIMAAGIGAGMVKGAEQKRQWDREDKLDKARQDAIERESATAAGEDMAVFDTYGALGGIDPDVLQKSLDAHLADMVTPAGVEAASPSGDGELLPIKPRAEAEEIVPLKPGDKIPTPKAKGAGGPVLYGGLTQGAAKGKARAQAMGVPTALTNLTGGMTDADAVSSLEGHRGRAQTAAAQIGTLKAQAAKIMNEAGGDLKLMTPMKRREVSARLKPLLEELKNQSRLYEDSFHKGMSARQETLATQAFNILATGTTEEAANFMASQPNAFDPGVIAAVRMGKREGDKIFLGDGSVRSLAGFGVSSGMVNTLTGKDKMNFLMRETEHLNKISAQKLHDQLMADSRIRAAITTKTAGPNPMKDALDALGKIAELERQGKTGSQEYIDTKNLFEKISTLLPASTAAGAQAKATSPAGQAKNVDSEIARVQKLQADAGKQVVKASGLGGSKEGKAAAQKAYKDLSDELAGLKAQKRGMGTPAAAAPAAPAAAPTAGFTIN